MNAADSPKNSIAIIGGGIVGMSIAWRLAQLGRRVTVFDQGVIGKEASWAGAGMLAPGGELIAASTIARLAIESRKVYPEFVRELNALTGIEIDYQDCGALEFAFTEGEARELDRRAREQEVLGIPSKPVSVEKVATFWPRVRTEGLVSARFYPEDGIVDPRDVMRALTEAARRSQVEVIEHCPVLEIQGADYDIRLTTARGVHAFDFAVLAAGAWSGAIAVSGLAPLPSSEPIKGHLIGYRQPEQTCNTIVRHGHTYLLQRANGLLIAGASEEHAGFDRGVKPEIAAQLAIQAGYLLPHLAEATPTEVWIGFRPGSDALHVGRWQSSRLFLAYGHYRNGILLAPATARNLASEINASLGRR